MARRKEAKLHLLAHRAFFQLQPPAPMVAILVSQVVANAKAARLSKTQTGFLKIVGLLLLPGEQSSYLAFQSRIN